MQAMRNLRYLTEIDILEVDERRYLPKAEKGHRYEAAEYKVPIEEIATMLCAVVNLPFYLTLATRLEDWLEYRDDHDDGLYPNFDFD